MYSVVIRLIKTWLIGILFYWITKKVFPEQKMVESISVDQPDVPVSDTIPPIPRGGINLTEYPRSGF